MIFVTVGTHDQEFTRLVKHMDEIAPKLMEEVIIQRGFTKYLPKNCESFDFKPSLEEYYQRARIVLIHGASSVWEFSYKYKKPIILVPRQYKFKEHINDHQVEFAESFSYKTGVKTILDIKELTLEFLREYDKIARINPENLIRLKNFMKRIIENEQKK